jgi:hypothetical protein
MWMLLVCCVVERGNRYIPFIAAPFDFTVCCQFTIRYLCQAGIAVWLQTFLSAFEAFTLLRTPYRLIHIRDLLGFVRCSQLNTANNPGKPTKHASHSMRVLLQEGFIGYHPGMARQ